MDKRPLILRGATYEVPLANGVCWVVINHDENGSLYEVFCYAEKTNTDLSAYTEALGRCISIGLRHGVPVEEFIDQLKDIQSIEPVWFEDERILSVPDGIAKVLQKELDNNGRVPSSSDNHNNSSIPKEE